MRSSIASITVSIEQPSAKNETRVVFPGWYPVNELSDKSNFITEAKRYL